MDVFFTPWLTEEDAKPTNVLAFDCACESKDGDPYPPLTPTTSPSAKQGPVKKTKKQQGPKDD
jgi:hypothetical protein